jgi:hypothetical protein
MRLISVESIIVGLGHTSLKNLGTSADGGKGSPATGPEFKSENAVRVIYMGKETYQRAARLKARARGSACHCNSRSRQMSCPKYSSQIRNYPRGRTKLCEYTRTYGYASGRERATRIGE